MALLLTFMWAVLMAIFGFSPPGMMNMTIVKIAIENTKSRAYQFMLGTLVIIALQAFIAVTFSTFFAQNPQVISYFKYVGILVFFGLAYLFYSQSKKQSVSMGLNNGSFIEGVRMASMNMLAIPFFTVYSTSLNVAGKIINTPLHNMFFVLGAVAGCAIIFSIYLNFAQLIAKRSVFIAKNINLILAVLFTILGILTLINVLTT